jgi:hypothetical protein
MLKFAKITSDEYLVRIVERLTDHLQELMPFAHLNKDVLIRFEGLCDARRMLLKRITQRSLLKGMLRVLGEEITVVERED